MPKKNASEGQQIALRKISAELVRVPTDVSNSVRWWAEQYFRYEVTTSPSSQKVQRRDLEIFICFLERQEGGDFLRAWSARLSAYFQQRLLKEVDKRDRRVRSDRTINRVVAHLKTFASWIHKLRPFPLENPMEKIKLLPVGSGLEVERALTVQERRKMLDAADLLLRIGGESKDRSRNRREGERPKRKGYRAYRNRAIIYTLIETGMRRAAVRNLNLVDVDFKRKSLLVVEKGGGKHRYQISGEGLQAIRDYIEKERAGDESALQLGALFLPAANNGNAKERLSVVTVDEIWKEWRGWKGRHHTQRVTRWDVI
jgi:integrase